MKVRGPAVLWNSSRGGNHVLRGAHERNCACAPCLSLTPTHVTEKRVLPSRSSPSLLYCRYVLSLRVSYTCGDGYAIKPRQSQL